MSVLEYIILSFALTVPVMVTLRACALKNPIRLTRGLGVSFLVAIVHVLLILAGIYIGNLLRFELPEYDSLIYLGLLVVVALRMFFPASCAQAKTASAVPYSDVASPPALQCVSTPAPSGIRGSPDLPIAWHILRSSS